MPSGLDSSSSRKRPRISFNVPSTNAFSEETFPSTRRRFPSMDVMPRTNSLRRSSGPLNCPEESRRWATRRSETQPHAQGVHTFNQPSAPVSARSDDVLARITASTITMDRNQFIRVQDTLMITAIPLHAPPPSRSEAALPHRQYAFGQPRPASHFFCLGSGVRRHLLLPRRLAACLFSEPPRSHRRSACPQPAQFSQRPCSPQQPLVFRRRPTHE